MEWTLCYVVPRQISPLSVYTMAHAPRKMANLINCYRATLCQRGICWRRVSVCPSVYLSVCLSACHTPILYQNGQMQNHVNNVIRQPRDLAFGCQKSRRNSNRITPMWAPNRGGVGSNGDSRPISCYISETVQDWLILQFFKSENPKFGQIFTTRRYASICCHRVFAVRLSVCLSVCLSLAGNVSKRLNVQITQTTPYDSPGTPVC